MSGDFDSSAVRALKERLAQLPSNGDDWTQNRRKWLHKQIRQQRLSEARERGTHSDEEWQAILERFDHRRVRCGCLPDSRPCKDHIVPIHLGGSDAASNLQPLCRECNTAKGPDAFNWATYREAYGSPDEAES